MPKFPYFARAAQDKNYSHEPQLYGIDEQPPVTRIKRQRLFGLSQTNEET
jgi:hypothetical protein